MNREFEFRAKDLNNRWVYGYYFKHIKRQVSPIRDSLKDDDIEHLIVRDRFADWNMSKQIEYIIVNQNTIQQYTGIKDKNGVKIFEGDIVLINGKYSNYVVKYEDSIGKFILKGKTTSYDFEDFCGNECKIIGNVLYMKILN